MSSREPRALVPLRPALPPSIAVPVRPALGRPLLPRPPAPSPPPRPARPVRPAPRERPAPARPPLPRPAPEPTFAAGPTGERPSSAVIPPLRTRAYREIKGDCPLCGTFVPVALLQQGAQDLALYAVDIGGAVQPGRENPDNTRGSITILPWWDPATAEALEDDVLEAARRIVALAEARDLAVIGRERAD